MITSLKSTSHQHTRTRFINLIQYLRTNLCDILGVVISHDTALLDTYATAHILNCLVLVTLKMHTDTHKHIQEKRWRWVKWPKLLHVILCAECWTNCDMLFTFCVGESLPHHRFCYIWQVYTQRRKVLPVHPCCCYRNSCYSDLRTEPLTLADGKTNTWCRCINMIK